MAAGCRIMMRGEERLQGSRQGDTACKTAPTTEIAVRFDFPLGSASTNLSRATQQPCIENHKRKRTSTACVRSSNVDSFRALLTYRSGFSVNISRRKELKRRLIRGPRPVNKSSHDRRRDCCWLIHLPFPSSLMTEPMSSPVHGFMSTPEPAMRPPPGKSNRGWYSFSNEFKYFWSLHIRVSYIFVDVMKHTGWPSGRR